VLPKNHIQPHCFAIISHKKYFAFDAHVCVCVGLCVNVYVTVSVCVCLRGFMFLYGRAYVMYHWKLLYDVLDVKCAIYIL
jgi:hypothetical protein